MPYCRIRFVMPLLLGSLLLAGCAHVKPKPKPKPDPELDPEILSQSDEAEEIQDSLIAPLHGLSPRSSVVNVSLIGPDPGPIGTFLANRTRFDATAMVNEIERRLTGRGIVGFSYAIARSGRLLLAGGQGEARATFELKPIPPDPDSRCCVPMSETRRTTIASISKPLTAVAILHLLENSPGSVAGNPVGLDQPFFPFAGNLTSDPGEGVEWITVRQLLTHTSGLEPEKTCDEDSLKELLEAGVSSNPKTRVSDPPAPFDYENTNFCLLRHYLENVTQESYVKYVEREVLSPMEISRMSCQEDDSNPTLYYSAATSPDRVRGTRFGDFDGTCSAFGWYASALDLARFLVHFRHDTVLSRSSREQMINERLGVFVTSGARGNYYFHNGRWRRDDPDNRGFLGAVMGFPDGIDAVLLLNTVDLDLRIHEVLSEAYDASFSR